MVRSYIRTIAAPGVVSALILAAAVSAAAAPAATAATKAPAALPSPLKVLATIPFGGNNPTTLTVSPQTDEAWTANQSTNSVSVINGKTHKVTATITLPWPTGIQVPRPQSVIFSPVTGDAYVQVLASPEDLVVAINGRTHKVITTFLLNASDGDLLISPKTGDVYISDATASGTSRLTVVNGRTNKVIGAIPVSDQGFGAISPKTGDLYIPAYSGGRNDAVSVISGTTNKVIGTILLGNGIAANDPLIPYEIAVSPKTGDIYVVSTDHDGSASEYADGNSITVISGTTNKIIATFPDVPTLTHGGGDIAISPKTGDIYVSNDASDTVTVINGKSNKLIGYITHFPDNGFGPYSIQISPVTGDIYINGTNNTGAAAVWVFSGTTNEAIGTVKVYVKGQLAETPEGISPKTGDAYVLGDSAASSPEFVSVLAP